MSESHKGEKNYFFGKTHSPETLEKLRMASMGNQIWVGKHHSEESKAKISAAHTGKPSPSKGITLTAEQRAKISDSRKEFLQRDDAVKNHARSKPK